MFKEYKTIGEIYGPLMFVKKVEGVTYEELVEVDDYPRTASGKVQKFVVRQRLRDQSPASRT